MSIHRKRKKSKSRSRSRRRSKSRGSYNNLRSGYEKLLGFIKMISKSPISKESKLQAVKTFVRKHRLSKGELRSGEKLLIRLCAGVKKRSRRRSKKRKSKKRKSKKRKSKKRKSKKRKSKKRKSR
jgi:hypothetical protein